MKSNKIPYYARYAGVGLLLSAAVVQADISGKVFRDFNANGTFDTGASFNEVGMAGVTVKAFDATGMEKASATSAADGSYTLNGLTAGADYRVEFLWAESWLKPGSAGGTSVQFAKDGAIDVKLAVQNPAQYCQADPYIAIPEYLNGDPLGNGTSGEKQAIVAFGSQWAGNAGDTAPLYETLAIGKNVGAVGGLAYQPANTTLFMAAVAKRHVGFGPNGSGAIYKLKVNPTNGQASTAPELFVDLAALGINSGMIDRSGGALSINAAEPNRDPNAFDAVGKVSLGDVEVSDDQKTLWAVNLADRKLYGMSTNTAPTTAADLQAFDLVNAFNALGHTCVDGEFRPWALKAHNGLVYVGGVCSAENVIETEQAAFGASSDIDNQANRDKLHAYILALDPSKGTFSDVYDFPLNYSRAQVGVEWNGANSIPAEWRPWIKNWDQIHDPEPGAGSYAQTMYPQPMLTDIEFDDDGKTLILGLLDRAGHQLGNANSSPVEGDTNFYEGVTAGDILRVCPDASGKLALESNGSCGGKTTAGANTGEGPNNGEYYFAENYGSPGHAEIALGGLARIYGLGKTISNGFDTELDYRSGGTLWLNDSTGAKDSAYVIFDRDDDGSSNGVVEPRTPATFGKAAGLGDMEVMCDAAPVEVGNRVWNDTDGDGIQDADEAGIDGVEVVLTCGADTATVTTANGGQFLFSSASNATFMSAGESCKVTVNSAGQTSLDGLIITKQNADNVTDNQATTDLRDSDATSVGEVAFTVGNVGENNHTLDIGYKAAPVVDAWCPVGAVENFLLNGSFEQGAAGDNAPNWTGENNISTSSSVNPKPHGSQFAFTWTPETFYQDADISSVPEGQALKLSYYSGSHEPSDQAVSIQYLTAPGGTVIGTAQALAVTHDVDSDAQLAQQELILGAKPAGANAVRVSVYGGSVDFIKIDAMCLYAGEAPSVATLDFGDAPDTYKTLLATDGARHTIVSGLHLGAVVDAEADGQPNTAADGDGNDEDGVNFMTPLIPGEAAVIGVGTIQPRGSDAKLDGWIDFNGDGDFDDPGEQIASSRNIKASTLRDQASLVLDVNVPADAKFGQTYARFRLSTAGGLTPSGEAADGEVEDYAITLAQGATLGDYIWQDTNKDGIQDSGEPAVAGVLVNLIRVSDDKIVKSTFSDGNGAYLFTGIMPDTYQVEFVAPTGYSLTAATQGGDPDKDSDADSTTGRTPNISVALGDNQRQWDAGLVLTDNTLVYCDAVPFQPTELNETLSLPKFNSTLGNLTGVSISAYGATRQLIAAEVFASQAQTVKLKSSVEGFLTLPDATSVDTLTSYDSGSKALSAADGILDYWGTSAFALSDWDYATNSQTKVYSTLADFTAAADGVMVSLPYETMSGLSTVGGGGNTQIFQRTFAGASACVTYSYEKSVPAVDVELSKIVEPSTAKRGETVVYTLTAKNTGADVATGVVVADKLPNGVAYVSDDGGVGAYNAATGEWVVGDLAKDASKVLKITVTVK